MKKINEKTRNIIGTSIIILILIIINIIHTFEINELKKSQIKLTTLIMNNSQMIYNNKILDIKKKE